MRIDLKLDLVLERQFDVSAEQGWGAALDQLVAHMKKPGR